MKKVIIGFIAGALLMMSGQVIADSVNRVGLKVGAEAKVYLNGKQLSDAIIVDNKSYAPVRDIAEAFNSDVEFVPATNEQKAVINLEMKSDAETIAELAREGRITDLNTQKEFLLEEQGRMKQAIENIKESIAEEEAEIDSVRQEWAKEIMRAGIEGKKSTIAQNEARLLDIAASLTEIEEELAELEAQ